MAEDKGVKSPSKMHGNKRIILAIVAVIVAIVVITSVLYIVPSLEKKNDVELGQYMKVSSSDLLSDNASSIFFISWYGCPYGADNSWVLYDLINSTQNISKDVMLHSSAVLDFYNNNPGLLFLGGTGLGSTGMNMTFTFGGVPFNFQSYYMYNQTMTGSVKNVPVSSSNRTSFGLSELKAVLPTPIYNTVVKYQTQVDLMNYTEPIAMVQGHLVTMEIITGPDGAFVHFGFMFPPYGVIRSGTFNPAQGDYGTPMTPAYVFANYKNMTGITNAEQQLVGILTTVNAACAPT